MGWVEYHAVSSRGSAKTIMRGMTTLRPARGTTSTSLWRTPRSTWRGSARYGDCVIAKTEQFLEVLKDPNADSAKKAEALKFVIHFEGDMHQPLYCEG
jgi:hypothetical protein